MDFYRLVLFFFLLPIMSLDSGNSGMRILAYPQAQKIYNFYATGGADTTYKSVPEMNPYGMWFDTFTVVVVKAFKIDDYQTTRHIMNRFSVFAILFADYLPRIAKDGGRCNHYFTTCHFSQIPGTSL